MHPISTQDVKSMIRSGPGPKVSIYVPTHRIKEDAAQDVIRLKNSLSLAEKSLVERGMRAPEAEDLLSPARDLLVDEGFWATQSDGLALFISTDQLRRYRLSHRFEPYTVVSDRYHIKPLIPLISGGGRYFILAVSLEEVRLMGGNEYSVDDIEVEEMPQGIAEALRYDDPERRLQFHTTTETPSGAERAAQFYGHGVGTKEKKKDRILRNFQRVADHVHSAIGSGDAPLVLAGVEYLLPIYRQAAKYPHIVDESIPGNPERVSHDEFHRQSWQPVEPLFRQKRQAHLEQYYTLKEEGRASGDLGAVIYAAYRGLVRAIFVTSEQELWGRYDEERDRIEVDEGPTGSNVDLLDLAAARTIADGGAAYALSDEQMPDQEMVAAVFRDGMW